LLLRRFSHKEGENQHGEQIDEWQAQATTGMDEGERQRTQRAFAGKDICGEDIQSNEADDWGAPAEGVLTRLVARTPALIRALLQTKELPSGELNLFVARKQGWRSLPSIIGIVISVDAATCRCAVRYKRQCRVATRPPTEAD
jgi:hypothetical protein